MSKTANVAVIFYSRDGSTETLAKAIAEGALAEGAEVRLLRAREIVGPEVMAHAPGWAENAERMNALYAAPTAADVEWADAVIWGSPTRFGSVSSELRAFIDSLGGLWASGKTVGKVGSAFTSTATPHGGNEATILSMYTTMAHFGMVVVAPGFGEPAAFGSGTPYGASSVAGQGPNPPTDGDLAVARYQGKRAAQVASKLKA
ncbi:MAG: NAD(P)H:quinone oxidoreductase [Armatimonadetes bacterium]|nr:NAD(P)H:quinone oxidoreductase [Armatimonadota bacterium]